MSRRACSVPRAIPEPSDRNNVERECVFDTHLPKHRTSPRCLNQQQNEHALKREQMCCRRFPPTKTTKTTSHRRRFLWSAKVQIFFPLGPVHVGDFSLSLSLVAGTSDASHLTSTTVRTEEETASKWPSAAVRIAQLQSKSASVLHGIDAATLSSGEYDRILFTFPLVILPTSNPENKELVRKFLLAAKQVLKPQGV